MVIALIRMRVKAPGVVKLLGEHAVVYGKFSVTATVGMYTYVDIERTGASVFKVDDLGTSSEFDRKELESIYKSYSQRASIESYIAQHSNLNPVALPYATIAAKLMNLHGVNVFGKVARITSEIPLRSGLASSATCFSAFTVALLNHEKETLEASKLIDIARDGERIVHRNENAGGMDVSTTYYGGYVSYSKSTGPKKESIDTDLDLLLIDTGPKRSTAEMVGHVAELYKNDRSGTEKILEEIDGCAKSGLEMLKKKDMRGLGALMFRDQELLKRLGVSSDGLDRAVEVAKRAGAYGAKLSGGGGGGLAIAIGGNLSRISNALESAGFKVSRSSVALDGTKAT